VTRWLVLAVAVFALAVATPARADLDPVEPDASWGQRHLTAQPPIREYGEGLVRFRGKGPERYWNELRAAKREMRRLERRLQRRWNPTAHYAYKLAATVYGVSEWELRAIGWCESRHFVHARNGSYRGVMQEGPMFERGPFGRAGFSVWDPVANVMTAAHTRVADGSWRQWACRP
jgi:hypothetical protein